MILKDFKDIDQIFRDNQHGFDSSPAPETWLLLKERLKENKQNKDHLLQSKQPLPLSKSQQHLKISPIKWWKYAAIFLIICIPLSTLIFFNHTLHHDTSNASKTIMGEAIQGTTDNNKKEEIKGIIVAEEVSIVYHNKEASEPAALKSVLPTKSINFNNNFFTYSRYHLHTQQKTPPPRLPSHKNFDAPKNTMTKQLKDTDWLLGNWSVKMDNLTFSEEWKKVDEQRITGNSASFFKEKYVLLYEEKLLIDQKGKDIFYHILDKENIKATYLLQNANKRQLVFEQIKDESPDALTYPKKIIYTLQKNNILKIYFDKLPYKNAFIYPAINLIAQ